MLKAGLPIFTESDNLIPDRIVGYVSVRGAESVFGASSAPRAGMYVAAKSTKAFHATPTDRKTVREDLEKSGFEILAESPLGFSVVAAPTAYELITGGKIEARERLTLTARRRFEYVTHLDIVGPGQPKTLGVGAVTSPNLKVDGVVLERPRAFRSVFPSPIPPNSPKFHLRLPGDVATLLGANAVHQRGIQGEGVLVAMPDSGWYRHPYFTANGYKANRPIVAVPGTSPNVDPIGHGTGESANMFAMAPRATLQPLRGTDSQGKFVAVLAAFLKAKALSPAIITNSWGGDSDYPPSGPPDEADQSVALEIQDAIERGILVVFSAGNGQFSIEPQVPGVLAAGGVFVDQDGQMQASDYASGYRSPWFDGVIVPTVCGLVGMQPRAQYLMLPVQPRCQLDTEEARPDSGEDGDGTTESDGWGLFSGTSAAAPQLAGAAALILGAKRGLSPAQVIEALSRTAVDVVTGASFPQRFNQPAGAGRDNATGWGLINASAAVDYALANF
jgi:subtilisin family serine protease